MPKQSDVQAWLDKAEAISELTKEQREQVETLLGSSAMLTLLGLMLGARQALLVGLSRIPIINNEAVATASVIQGKIQGIDLLPQTLLELCTGDAPAAPVNEGAKD